MLTQNLDQDAQVTSGETQLKSFGSFLDNYDSRLTSLLNGLTNGHAENFHSNLDKVQIESSAEIPTITISYTPPSECISIFRLADSDNKTLNKVLATFSQLCDEGTKLKTAARQHQFKLLYFDEHLCAYEEQGEECLNGMGDLLELLYSVQYLSQRCITVASTILQQLGALFTYRAIDNRLDLQLAMQFQEVFNRLSETILQLIVFDEILVSSRLQNFWQTYKKAIYSISRNKDRFNHPYTEYEISGLTNVLNSLEMLFAGSLFQTFLDSIFKIKEQISTKALPEISGHFQDYIRVNLTSIEKFSSVLSDLDETELIIRINAICVLFHHFFGQLEQKVLKQLLDVNSKNVGITLIGNIMWSPEQFLKKHAQTLMKSYDKYLQERISLRQVYLQTKIQVISQETKQYCSLTLTWCLKMNSVLNSATHKFQVVHFKNLCGLFLQGLKYAGQLSNLIKSITNLHVLLHLKMAKPTLLSICKLIEYLRIAQLTFQNNFVKIGQIIQCVIQYLTYKTLFIIATVKKKLATQPSRNERNLDTLSALQIAEKCVYGPATKCRMLIASLALNFANPMRVLTPEHLQKLHKIFNRLILLSDLQSNIERLCDPSFMYWHQSILIVYLKQVIDIKGSQSLTPHAFYTSMKYLVQSADTCSKNFEELYAMNNFKTIDSFSKMHYKQYRQEVAVKLCAQIETFLRIHVHENLAQNKPNPFTNGLEDCRDLVNISPVQINGFHVVLKDQIENYLSNMFYNLTTISLHDWRTYSEMRHLGNYKFNLVTIGDHLPTQQLEQGIDVLEIMRNIHIFVSKYLYNMNNQIFIEYSSNNKHLNTIGIRHIANSLRTHGTGIINTTVNFTYQFLRKKLYTFSQFLYDEHIKSRLMKDLKYFRGGAKDGKDRSASQMYNYERADSFNKGIRKFGLTPDGQSYLDLFRQLISHIGNAMGYIRLMRSGGIHASSNVSVYLPKLDDNLDFAKATCGIDATMKAAENLENNIQNLSKCFSDETEYFKLLIEAFTPFFRDPKNMHLRNFYLVVPALTINFVEYIINAKDKIHKRDKQGVLFVDDGLAIGLAYLLRLLNQTSEFNSLHWFKSVKEHFINEKSKIIAQRTNHIAGATGAGSNAGSPNDDKLQQTLTLSEKRLNAHQMEFNLLYYNIQSSKIFFRE